MQVALNLLINARDAISGSDGVIRIRSWSIEGDEPFAFGFSVSDNGCGISEESMGKLFDAFYTTKPSGHGTGLGLSISQQIIEQHNGRISAENNLDKGATFTVLLPAMV